MKNIIEYLITNVKKTPRKIALIDSQNQMTYHEFWGNVLKISYFFSQTGITGQPIGVIAERNVYTPVMFLGICSSNNFYVPLDPEMPEEKKLKIIRDSEMKMLLTDDISKSPSFSMSELPCTLYSLSQILLYDISTVNESIVDINNNTPEKPLCLIYTSGSTGRPKGVLKSHKAMIDFIEAFTDTFSFCEDEVIGNQTPFYFDASAKDLYLSLKLGITMTILPTELFSFPVRLIEYMNRQKVTTIFWVPSALSIVTQLNTFSEIKPETLQKVFFVGECFPMKQLNKWRSTLPNLQYINLYGSTEIAGICCYYEIPPNQKYENTDMLPIGRPLKNCSILLMKEETPITTADKTGEIWISSNALALEYYHDPCATSDAFITTAYGHSEPNRFFKTGDMAHYDKTGNLVFETRKDFQIKHMGHRIELGEIESMALSLEEIEQCGCIYDEEKDKIVLFCKLKKGVALTGRELQSLLRGRLSPYMLPGKIIILEKMLLNANGKIDRPALKRLI